MTVWGELPHTLFWTIMAKVLFNVGKKFYYGESGRGTAWGIVGNHTGMRSALYARADKVYIERPNGYFKQLKNRFSNDLEPLTNKEGFMWVLKSEYVDLKTVEII